MRWVTPHPLLPTSDEEFSQPFRGCFIDYSSTFSDFHTPMLEGANAPSATAKLLIRHKTAARHLVSEVEKGALIVLTENFCEREPRHQRHAHRQPNAALV